MNWGVLIAVLIYEVVSIVVSVPLWHTKIRKAAVRKAEALHLPVAASRLLW